MCRSQKNRKENEGIAETSLKEIEENIKKNASQKEAIMKDFERNIKKQKMKKGRVRPRDKTKQRILDSFKRK